MHIYVVTIRSEDRSEQYLGVRTVEVYAIDCEDARRRAARPGWHVVSVTRLGRDYV